MRSRRSDLALIARRLPTVGVVVAVAVMIAQTAAYLVDGLVLEPTNRELIARGEGSAFDWFSVFAVLTVAASAGFHAAYLRHRRRAFALLATIFIFLAVDDALGLHERVTSAVGGWLDVSDHGDTLFLLPYLPPLAFAFGLLLTTARESGSPARGVMHLGLLLLAVTLATRVLAALMIASGITLERWEKALGVAVIHDTEIGGWLLVASGLASGVCARVTAFRTPRNAAAS
jgi:hypothetical protein